MTTVAGDHPASATQPTCVAPGNRAVDALLSAEPGNPVSDLDAVPEPVRLSAAYDMAQAILTSLPLLTLRERMVLAGALLPEFDMPTDA